MLDMPPQTNPPPEKQPRLSILEDVGRKAQEDMEHMRPLFEQAAKFHRQTQEAFAPIINSVWTLQETARPALQAIFASRKMLTDVARAMRLDHELGAKMFILPSRQRQPSAEEIAEALFKKLEQNNQVKQRTKASDKKKVILVPAGAQWNELRLDLKDNRSIDVSYKKQVIGNYDFEYFGLVRKNTDRKIPNRQSEFLKLLAFATMPGVAFKPTIAEISKHLKISESACHQIKKLLSKKLGAAFGIQGNPFYPYDYVDGYRPRFELRPESLLRDDGEIHRSGGILEEEIADYTENY